MFVFLIETLSFSNKIEKLRIRFGFDNCLRWLANMSTLPWCIMGDFNDLPYAADKRGNNSHPQYLLDGFCDTIADSQLIDLDLSGENFTWEKGRGSGAWVCERLDRSFASASRWSKFPLCHLKVVQTPRSDHDPLVLELFKVDVPKKNFTFRFENI